MPDYEEGAPPVFDTREATMTEEGMTLSENPLIEGDVEYRFNFNMIGSPRDFEVEITSVDVTDIKNVTSEEGTPMALSADKRYGLMGNAYDYFWKHLESKAENAAIERVRWGPVG